MPLMFEKPLGMIDTLPALYERAREVRHHIERETETWGYRPIQTPSLEYYDTIGEASAIRDEQLFKLLDREGKTLVLRPDMTAPIARVISSGMKEEPLPLRLSYCNALFRAQQHEGGRRAEFEQFGVELVGDDSMNADGEVLALLTSGLRASGLSSFRLAVGHIKYMNALFEEIVEDEAMIDELRRYLYEKNFVGYRQFIDQLKITDDEKDRLRQLQTLRGGPEILEKAKTIAHSRQAHKAINEIEDLWGILQDLGVQDVVQVDLNIVGQIDYYTGIVFEGYGGSLGFPLASGGRYDELLGKFGRPASATGFGIRLDRLLEALNHINEGNLQKQPTLILFSKERQQEALQEANRRRKNNEAVVMQNIAGVPDIETFTKKYADVVSLTATERRGEKDDA
ncbi:ATP phosphoribosyltransferase regulatory subunit [Salicibibacter kimchii]|uniref:ATP phosphoribosyltransferase regulatory subunit n=1 Tax=Salicibibacter kimchii TaxID=2099786 RepID=A0A345BZ97_9BACI|nr:ATP phosphoribosyltransferase regulatory subunit [Salicibibacter kimchii]AXF56278.1 ATP phosphoribosyltransferase regulatory subunit [Salicibibacter kimchii]